MTTVLPASTRFVARITPSQTDWPVPCTETPLYLAADGALVLELPGAALVARQVEQLHVGWRAQRAPRERDALVDASAHLKKRAADLSSQYQVRYSSTAGTSVRPEVKVHRKDARVRPGLSERPR